MRTVRGTGTQKILHGAGALAFSFVVGRVLCDSAVIFARNYGNSGALRPLCLSIISLFLLFLCIWYLYRLARYGLVLSNAGKAGWNKKKAFRKEPWKNPKSPRDARWLGKFLKQHA